MMDTIKRITLATVITALVWSYADQIGETTERIRVTIQILKDPDWYVSTPTLTGRIVLSGTRRSMQALREQAPAGLLRIEQKADELGLAPGPGLIDLARLVGTAQLVRDLGLRVVEAEPATLEIEVDEFESHEVSVVRAEPGGALTVTFTPRRVTARVPSLVWAANPDSLYAEFSLDGLRPAAGTNEPSSQDVLLTVPTSLRSHPITFDPPSVTVHVQVDQKRETAEFPGVPIRVVKSWPLEKEWVVQLVAQEGTEEGLFTVDVVGPAEIIQQLKEGGRGLQLLLVVHREDASSSEPVERALQLGVPNPAWAATVHFAKEAPKVKFRLRRFTLPSESSG